MNKRVLPALKAAFPHTLPILAGFVALGMGYGIYHRSAGLPIWFAPLTSILVFGGSLEFLLVSMLLAPFHPLIVFFLSLLVSMAFPCWINIEARESLGHISYTPCVTRPFL